MSERLNYLTNFPDEFAHPDEKRKPAWGLQAAKGIFYTSTRSSPQLFYNDRSMLQKYVEYALGDQDEDKYKPVLGIKPEDSKNTWVSAIRWQIKNYATKRINIATAKITDQKYEPRATAIDPLAIDHKSDYKSRMKAYMKDSAWYAEMSKVTGTSFAPGGVDPEIIPRNDEELQIHMEMDWKHRGAMELEMGIAHHLKENNMDELRSQAAFDNFVLGAKAFWAGLDENMRPKVRRCDISRLILPYSETPNFENMRWVGYVMDMPVVDFVKLARKTYDADTVEHIVNTHAKKLNNYRVDHTGDHATGNEAATIQVMHFEYMTTEETVYLKKKDKFGNSRSIEKDHSFYRGKDEEFKEKYGDERQISRIPLDIVMEGNWVVGSDYIIDYKQKENTEIPFGQLGVAKLGYKIYAPNMRNGKIVSNVKQMIPILDNLQSYNLKIQHLVARAIPKGVGIDLFALRKADLKWSGRQLTDQQKIEMFFQSGIFVFNSEDRYAPGSNYKPFYEAANGISDDVEKYLRLIQQELFDLEEVTGINKVAAASSLASDAGARVTAMQANATDVAFDYLYRADRTVYRDLCETVGILHLYSVKYGNNDAYYRSIIGQSSIDFIKETPILDQVYAVDVEIAPTKSEWENLYADVNMALGKGMISLADKIAVMRFTNLKQAYAWLRLMEQRRMKAASESKVQDVQMNAQQQQQSATMKFEFDKQLKMMEAQMKEAEDQRELDRIMLQHRLKMQEIEKEAMLNGGMKSKQIKEQGDQKVREVTLKEGINALKPEPSPGQGSKSK